MKILRRVAALIAIGALAFKGVLSFLNWFEKHDDDVAWSDEEDFEEVL